MAITDNINNSKLRDAIYNNQVAFRTSKLSSIDETIVTNLMGKQELTFPFVYQFFVKNNKSNPYVNISRIQKFGKICLMLNCFSNISQVYKFFLNSDNHRFAPLAHKFADYIKIYWNRTVNSIEMNDFLVNTFAND